jgi:AraC family transcriptional activator of tynA and feaB
MQGVHCIIRDARILLLRVSLSKLIAAALLYLVLKDMPPSQPLPSRRCTQAGSHQTRLATLLRSTVDPLDDRPRPQVRRDRVSGDRSTRHLCHGPQQHAAGWGSDIPRFRLTQKHLLEYRGIYNTDVLEIGATVSGPRRLLMQAISTTLVATASEIGAWNQLCSKLFSPIEIEPLERQSFVGQMEILCDEEVKVTRFKSAPVSMRRTRVHTRSAAQTRLTAFLRLSGKAHFSIEGAKLTMKAGDLILLDSHTRFEFQADGDTAALAIGFPDYLLSAHLPDVGAAVGKVMDGDLPLVGCATATMRVIQRQTESGTPSQGLARALLELVSASCERMPDAQQGSPSEQRWHRRIDAFISSNLKDHELSPRGVAEAMGLSQRYLRKLSADSGEPLSQKILRLRLEECARCLLNPAWKNISITELAHHWGFEESGYFARRFRRRFDCSPSVYRSKSTK